MNSTKLENIEHIEQLRILENKIVINAVEVEVEVEVDDEGMSVDTIDNLIKIRKRRDWH